MEAFLAIIIPVFIIASALMLINNIVDYERIDTYEWNS